MSWSRPSVWAIGWRAIRPHTLPLSLSPVLAGSLVGWIEGGVLRPDITAAAALSAACMQIGANLQNDAADALNGTDSPARPGPPRVTQLGWASAETMQRSAWLAFALAVLAGVYLVMIGGWPLLGLGLVAVVAAWAYSGGPRPISRGPWGELVVLFFFGLVAVGGVAWLYTGSVSATALLMGLVIGLPAAAVLTINNLRDHASDRQAGRRTLAILLGPHASARLIAGLLLAVAPGLMGLALLGRPWSGALAGLLALSLALPLARRVAAAKTAAGYNLALKQTTLFQLLLTLLIVLGVGLVWNGV
ncbi:MAG: 1,4-dihydroxy-2-naphthoate octaprenyltransferase [Wenzhouxiangella sp.]